MLRLMAKRMSQIEVAGSSDTVLFGVSLPSGSRINGVRAEVHIESTSVGLNSVNLAHIYAVEGWILPVVDPDLGDSYDDIFDALVPKDTDTDALNLDTVALDQTPFYEPGEVTWEELMDVGMMPERIFHRHRVLTTAKLGISRLNAADTAGWWPHDYFEINIRKNYAIHHPSILVFAIGSPAGDDTSATIPTAAAETEWGQTKYMGEVLRRGLLHLLGLVEAGAETPWEEATALLKKHLEPDVYEVTDGSLGSLGMWVFCQATIDHSVQGDLGKSTVSTGR